MDERKVLSDEEIMETIAAVCDFDRAGVERWRREALIIGHAVARAALAATQAEPIYQTCFIQGQWRDVDRFEYDRAKSLRADLARIVYAAPVLETATQAGWQPIETAPKDGTPIMLFARHVRATAPIRLVGWWNTESEGWIDSVFWPNVPQRIVPSHWRELPAAPDSSVSSKED